MKFKQKYEVKFKQKYEGLVKTYEERLKEHPDEQRTRNLLAFAYLNDGRIEDARRELVYLIEKNKNFTAYRQMIHLEKIYGDIEDAEIYGLEALEKFPDDKRIQKQVEDIYKEKTISQKEFNNFIEGK